MKDKEQAVSELKPPTEIRYDNHSESRYNADHSTFGGGVGGKETSFSSGKSDYIDHYEPRARRTIMNREYEMIIKIPTMSEESLNWLQDKNKDGGIFKIGLMQVEWILTFQNYHSKTSRTQWYRVFAEEV